MKPDVGKITPYYCIDSYTTLTTLQQSKTVQHPSSVLSGQCRFNSDRQDRKVRRSRREVLGEERCSVQEAIVNTNTRVATYYYIYNS